MNTVSGLAVEKAKMNIVQPPKENQPTGANISPLRRDRSLGAILIDSGRLKPSDAERILLEQKARNMRFGEAAIALGLLQQKDIDFALSFQFDYPSLPAGDHSVSEELIAAFKPNNPIAEQIRALRSQLMLRWFNGEPSQAAIAVVSPGRGDGRSFIAANLAVVFSQLGERTLLVDADMRHPKQHKLFKLQNRLGLSALLTGRAGLETVARMHHLPDLFVLPAGAEPPNPQELLERPQFGILIEQLSREYDAIIIDTPSGMQNVDAQVVAAKTGAAVMVVRKNYTAVETARTFAKGLGYGNARIIGSVLNQF